MPDPNEAQLGRSHHGAAARAVTANRHDLLLTLTLTLAAGRGAVAARTMDARAAEEHGTNLQLTKPASHREYDFFLYYLLSRDPGDRVMCFHWQAAINRKTVRGNHASRVGR
jgi:hypothetical protein